ncbi:MAG TPA: hypothetical protein VML75_24560 [Kofleriaceae bacterium]|nr:hypothetical protein [Kofleriaceae bacterium]
MGTELVRQVDSVSLATQSRYLIKRKFWSVFERTFRVFTGDGQLMMLVKHPVFRLREEFTVFADEARSRPLLLVKSRQVVAINFCFDVVDASTGDFLGSVQKRGLRSLVRDKFLILDPGGNEIGYSEEQGASIIRRFIPLLTSKHAIFINGQQVAFIRQVFRFFTKEFEVTIVPGTIDNRFVLACALLALIAEARRESE